MKVCEDFVSFMQTEVLPHKSAHLGDIRLDGDRTGGKLKAFGHFRHNGRDWEVHEDTHYEPLMIAYEAASTGADPFVEQKTKRRLRLALTDELRRRHKSRFAYLYIYSLGEGKPKR